MRDIDIEKLSELANIDLSQVDRKKLKEDLGKIINHIQKIHEVDVNKVKETTHPYQTALPLRKDVPSDSLTQEQVLSNTEEKSGGFFIIERLINENDN